MLSKKTLETFNFSFQVITKLKCVPFKWNSKKHIFEKLNRVETYQVYIVFVLDTLYRIFNMISAFFMLQLYDSYSRKAFTCMYIYLLVTCFCLNCVAFIHRNEIVQFANSFLQLTKKLSKSNTFFSTQLGLTPYYFNEA